MILKNRKIIAKDILKSVANPPFIYNSLDYGFSKKLTGKDVKIGIISTGKPTHNDLQNLVEYENFCEKSKSIDDKDGLATLVSGVIGSGSDQIIGLSRDAELYFVKAYSDSGDVALESSLVSSILWLIIKRVDIIVIVNTLDCESIVLQDAISKAYDSNICLFSYNTDDDNFPEILGIHQDFDNSEKCNYTLKLEEKLDCYTLWGKDKYVRTPYDVYSIGVVAGLAALVVEDKKGKEKYTPRDIYSELVKKINKK